MKKSRLSLFFTLVLFAGITGCCKNKTLSDEEVIRLLDSTQKHTVKFGCSKCDDYIQSVNVEKEINKEIGNYRIAEPSNKFFHLTNYNTILYKNYERNELFMRALMESPAFDDSLISFATKDTLYINYTQSAKGCDEFIPELNEFNDSIVITLLRTLTTHINCDKENVSFQFMSTSCINVIETKMLVEKKYLKNKKVYLNPSPKKLYFIPLEKDTIYQSYKLSH